MQEFLKQIKSENYDVLTFFPGDEEGDIRIEGNNFDNAGEKLGGSPHGDCYQIAIFKESETEDAITHLDRFEAILTAPAEYMQGLIETDWYGLICRKTTTSLEFFNKAFDVFSEP